MPLRINIMKTNRYRIAEFNLIITFEEGSNNGSNLIPSFEPFRITGDSDINTEEILFHLHVDNNLKPLPKEERTRIKTVDTGNGDTIVDQTSTGDYQFIIKDVFGNSCCMLRTSCNFVKCKCALNGTESMRTFGLNNALMLIFAFAGSKKNALLIHASLVRHNGWGYAFTAKSGTGKSTQVSMWLKNIPGCDLMNDDNPIVRIIDNTPYIYGSPWSGKTPCYRNVKARLGAVVEINRSEKNYVERTAPIEAFATLLTGCSTMKWDNEIFNCICNIITKIIETTPNYDLYCRPDNESAIVCHKAISRSEK